MRETEGDNKETKGDSGRKVRQRETKGNTERERESVRERES